MEKYISHRITQKGFIEILKEKDGKKWGYTVLPNQSLDEYNEIIEADPLYAEYRTEENAQAYEESLVADQPTEEERLEQWRRSASLSRRRFKIGEALYEHNKTPLVELIEALLAGLEEPTKTIAGIAYRESAQFDRLDPFIVQFSGALGMTDEEVDAFFQYCIDEGWNA